MFLPIGRVWRSWVAERDFSVVTGRLRDFSEGRLPGQDEGDLGAALDAALRSVTKPTAEEEGAASRHQVEAAHIEKESPGKPKFLASNSDCHQSSGAMSSAGKASIGSSWLKATRRKRFRPRKTHPAMDFAAAIKIDHPVCLATLNCAISMEDRKGNIAIA